MEKQKILFVCLGNICRSPMGETVMRKLVDDKGLGSMFEIDSAGTAGYHIGDMPDMRMQQAARTRGYRMTSRARKVSVADFDYFDIILAMDDANYDDLCCLAPTLEAKAKIHRMAKFCRKHNADHIPDPYYGGTAGFAHVIDLLEDGCAELLRQITEGEI